MAHYFEWALLGNDECVCIKWAIRFSSDTLLILDAINQQSVQDETFCLRARLHVQKSRQKLRTFLPPTTYEETGQDISDYR